jgi:hypothetical protein
MQIYSRQSLELNQVRTVIFFHTQPDLAQMRSMKTMIASMHLKSMIPKLTSVHCLERETQINIIAGSQETLQ